MSLREISNQKKIEIRHEWENKIKKIISSAKGTHVQINTNSFPTSNSHMLRAEKEIVSDILDKAGLKYTWLQTRKMG